jgi:hypothetical protein
LLPVPRAAGPGQLVVKIAAMPTITEIHTHKGHVHINRFLRCAGYDTTPEVSSAAISVVSRLSSIRLVEGC